MKIALLISGRIQGYLDAYNSINKYIIQKYNPVIFSSNDELCNDFVQKYNISLENLHIGSIGISETGEYSPMYKVGPPTEMIYRTVNMYYHNKKVYELMSNFMLNNSMVFDIVIKIRPDMIINSEFTLPKNIGQNPSISAIYLHNSIGYPYILKDMINQCPDIYAIGSVQTMSVYCNLYDNLYKLYKNYGYNMICPEVLLYNWLTLNNIAINYFDKLDFLLSRNRFPKNHCKYVDNSLLQLVLVTKNSASYIENTIKSYRLIISYWTIIDLGSTDGTKDIIKSLLFDIPGILLDGSPNEPIYSAKNIALDNSNKNIPFTIVPDDTYDIDCYYTLLNYLQNIESVTECLRLKVFKKQTIDISNDIFETYEKLIFKTSANLRFSKNNNLDTDNYINFLYEIAESTHINQYPEDPYKNFVLKEDPYKNFVLKEDPESEFIYFIYLGQKSNDLEIALNLFRKATKVYPERSAESLYYTYLALKNSNNEYDRKASYQYIKASASSCIFDKYPFDIKTSYEQYVNEYVLTNLIPITFLSDFDITQDISLANKMVKLLNKIHRNNYNIQYFIHEILEINPCLNP